MSACPSSCVSTSQNCPYQANARNFGDVIKDFDEFATPVREGDIVIAASDGVLDNIFDKEIQACVSEHLTGLMDDDPEAAQLAITVLSKSIADRAHSVAMQMKDFEGDTPLKYAAAEEGYEFQGGKVDDIAIVCGVVREGEQAGLRVVHNFNGVTEGVMWLKPEAARGVVVPTQQQGVEQPASNNYA